MERERLVGHLIDHYIARDKFRHVASRHLQNRGLPSSTAFLFDGEIDQRTVERTGKSLDRCKHDTLDYLHELLHADFALDEDEHLHTDEDIFRFIIEEEEGLA